MYFYTQANQINHPEYQDVHIIIMWIDLYVQDEFNLYCMTVYMCKSKATIGLLQLYFY